MTTLSSLHVERITYRDIIRRYSDLVEKGHADTDLLPRQRRLVVVMLNLASSAGMAAVYYPPTDQTRDEVAHHLGDILWDARPLMRATSTTVDADLDVAAERAVAILRGS